MLSGVIVKMNEELRQRVIETLRRGEDLPSEWARELFPPEKREYELVYHAKEREEDILANTMPVPLQPVRTFGINGNGWQNMLILGDNAQALKTLLKMRERNQLINYDGSSGVRLVYIDPPFGTGDEYSAKGDRSAYSARIQGSRFIEFLRKRLILLRELMADEGVIFCRIDYHFGHYVKVILDEIFGEQNLQNEIIINRVARRLRNLTRLNVGTESIFFYSKSSSFYFSNPEMPRSCNFCGAEKKPIWEDLTSPGLRNPPERIIFGTEYLPRRNRHFMYTQENINELEREGRLRLNPEIEYYDLKGNKIEARPEYLQTESVPIDNNWTDLRGYAYTTDYPTENHEQLLERIIKMGSVEGDIVLDAFAGSGTTLAVAEKLKRRWIGIDRGKLSIYTIQKRMLNLRQQIGNTKGRRVQPKTFTLYNAGLYDFSTLQHLPWEDWRFFALQLFECRDEFHVIGGMQLDGKRKGASVYVFNHLESPNQRIDEETIHSIHSQIGSRVGNRFFIIAPRNVFDFQQDYIDIDDVRYYALRIPYSFINELHRREFSALQQPTDETAINDLIDAEGFDFIQPPLVTWEAGLKPNDGKLFPDAFLKITTFESKARIRGKVELGGLETLSMILIDFDYDGKLFELDDFIYASQLDQNDWCHSFPTDRLGKQLMVIFIDIYGNESIVVIPNQQFHSPPNE